MRNTHVTLAATALALTGLTGCYVASFFVPVTKTPADQAHDLDKKCRGFSDPGALSSLLPDSAIDSVEPAYSHVVDPPADHLRGAKIHVRPLPGISKETLTRTLECHEAGVVLGTVPATEGDPYTLPQHWLDFDVDSDGDAFIVLVRTGVEENIKDAQAVLARTRSYFAVTHRAASARSALPVSASPVAVTPVPVASPAAPGPQAPALPAPPSPAAASPAPSAPAVPQAPASPIAATPAST
jgi:hypothetical protein